MTCWGIFGGRHCIGDHFHSSPPVNSSCHPKDHKHGFIDHTTIHARKINPTQYCLPRSSYVHVSQFESLHQLQPNPAMQAWAQTLLLLVTLLNNNVNIHYYFWIITLGLLALLNPKKKYCPISPITTPNNPRLNSAFSRLLYSPKTISNLPCL